MGKIFFLSDCHFGAATMETPLDYERRVVRFLWSIKDECEELFLLGDIIDYWFEYRHVAPQGYTRFLGTLALMADSGVRIHWFTGNHDIWIFHYLPREIGCEVHRAPCTIERRGKRLFLAHGDGLGDDRLQLRLMTRFFHNRVCQWLFRQIHPDWTMGFALWWSKKSRLSGDTMPDYRGEAEEPLVRYVKARMQHEHDIDYYLFGHRHILLDLMLSRTVRMMILGDWLHHFSYAVMDESGNLSLEQYEADTLYHDDEPPREGVSIALM